MAADLLRTAALDAGDRLALALGDADLDAAERALDDRQRALDALAGADALPNLAPDLAERFRAQEERLRRLLHDGLATARDALHATGRTATAHGRYRASIAAPAVLDTARRRG